jgi:hypothetical protein
MPSNPCAGIKKNAWISWKFRVIGVAPAGDIATQDRREQ